MMQTFARQLRGAERSGPCRTRLIANETQVMVQMGYRLADEPLWVREEVPVSGSGFADARALAVAARIDGSKVGQEAHFLVFRGKTAKYLVSLLTPAESDFPEVYQTNVAALGTLMSTFQPAGE